MKLLTPSPYEKRLVILLTGEFKDKWVSLKGAGNFTLQASWNNAPEHRV
jgi:hypothetical protein